MERFGKPPVSGDRLVGIGLDQPVPNAASRVLLCDNVFSEHYRLRGRPPR